MLSLLRFGSLARRLAAASPLSFFRLAGALLLLATWIGVADAQSTYTWDPGSSTSGA